ncbi:MAG: hypothetical protein V2B18_21810, partial [Pseudomonadota bacterium]
MKVRVLRTLASLVRFLESAKDLADGRKGEGRSCLKGVKSSLLSLSWRLMRLVVPSKLRGLVKTRLFISYLRLAGAARSGVPGFREG